MTYYFLQEDFEALRARIQDLERELLEVGQEMGEACTQSAETWHDNSPYEEATRHAKFLSQRLRELVDIYNQARVVDPPNGGPKRVALGRMVTVQDLDTGEEMTFKVGSYLVLGNNGTRSYRAPLVRLIISAEEGEIREGQVAGRHRALEVLAIE